MAIFGELRDLSFGELSRVLAPQTGTMLLERALTGRTAELHLHAGELRALFINGFPVKDHRQLQQTVQDLSMASAGAFEFQPSALHNLSDHHRLRLSDLLRGRRSEPAVPEEQLPHADTRFVVASRRGEAPKALWAAWALMQPLLGEGGSGSSASELAQQLTLDVQQIRLMLHGLRESGLISPLRAGTAAAPSATPKTGLVQRLLGTLRRLTGGQP